MSKPIDQEREAFAREDRYIVIKRKHLTPNQQGILEGFIESHGFDSAEVSDSLVIESDWPEYQVAWAMIEARITGKQPAGVAVPDGWKLVPIKPTAEMKAVCRVAGKIQVWADMIAASPVAPHPVSGEQSYPEGSAEALERTDWTPEEALRWYAEGRHFDVVHGRTRIIDTGSIASNALKHASLEHLEMKGDSELHELRQSAQDVAGLVEMLDSMVCAYRSAIATGYDRITDLGGQCDAVDYMLAAFPDYAKAKAMVAAHRAQQGEQPS